MISVKITLTSAGINVGPFDIYGESSNLLATGISRTTLTEGYQLNNVPNETTKVKVVSTDLCNGEIWINISGLDP